jgi:hypothetical protein
MSGSANYLDQRQVIHRAFRDELFAGVVMLDVLHHLERPIEFRKEASE